MFTFLACPLCFIMKCIIFCIFSEVNINISREKTGSWPWWHIPGSLALGRLRQEECFAFEPTWATWYTLGHTGVHWKTCRFGRRAACLLCKQEPKWRHCLVFTLFHLWMATTCWVELMFRYHTYGNLRLFLKKNSKWKEMCSVTYYTTGFPEASPFVFLGLSFLTSEVKSWTRLSLNILPAPGGMLSDVFPAFWTLMSEHRHQLY